MMNGPTPNVCSNTIDIYVRLNAYSGDGDADGNGAFASTPSFVAVPCSVQIHEGGPVTPSSHGNFAFTGGVLFNVASFPAGYTPRFRNKFVWADGLGRTRILFTDSEEMDQAGGGKAFWVPVVEYAIG